MKDIREDAKEFLRLVKASESAYVFTGAGISTPSGIPDFRGKDGLYSKVPPDIFDIEKFYENPKRYYKVHRERISKMRMAKPNVAHKVIAKLEEEGYIRGVITQNIDGLHQEAGSKNVVELHGSLSRYICTKCGKVYEADEIDGKLDEVEVPRCGECGGLIKPDVVFFGEALPEHSVAKAFRMAEEADLAIVVGSSLVVYPAMLVPRLTVEHGGRLIIINLGETGLDDLSFRKYEYDIAEFFKVVYELM